VTARGPADRPVEFEAFGASVGSAVICGALSVLAPVLDSATAALAALAVAGWVSRARQTGALARDRMGRSPVAALGSLGGAGVLFLVPPPALVPFRGLLLGVSLVPLFLAERSRSVRAPPAFSTA